MITFLRSNYLSQFALLAATGGAAWLVTYAGAYAPVVRIGSDTLIQGAASGLLAAAIIALVEMVLLLLIPGFEEQLRRFSTAVFSGSGYLLIGAAAAGIVAEEVLLRGLLFGWLERMSVAAAFAVNAAATAAIWWRPKLRFWPCLIKAVEGSLYAAFFWYNRSLFLAVTAHFVAEALSFVLLKSGKEPAALFRASNWIADETRARFGIRLKRRRVSR